MLNVNKRAKELAQVDRLSETKRFIRVAGYYIAIPLWLSCSILDFYCYPEKLVLFGVIRIFSALLTVWIVEFAVPKFIKDERSSELFVYSYFFTGSLILTSLIFMTGGASSFYLPFINIVGVTTISGFATGKRSFLMLLGVSYGPVIVGVFLQNIQSSDLNYLLTNTILSAALAVVAVGTRYYHNLVQIKECESRIRLSDEIVSRDEEIARRTEQALALELQASLGIQAAHIAHDIRSPLAALQIFSKTLKIQDDEMNMMTSILNRISGISEGLLAQYRNSQKNPLNKNFVTENQKNGITNVFQTLKKLLAEKEIEYLAKKDVRICAEIDFNSNVNVKMDADIFKRVISNLINNAVDACSAKNGGLVLVKGNVIAQVIKIVVSDTGNGMREDVLKNIAKGVFSHRNSSGNGLGLKYTFDEINRCEGRVEITSVAGEGTEVSLWLPLEEPVGITKS